MKYISAWFDTAAIAFWSCAIVVGKTYYDAADGPAFGYEFGWYASGAFFATLIAVAGTKLRRGNANRTEFALGWALERIGLACLALYAGWVVYSEFPVLSESATTSLGIAATGLVIWRRRSVAPPDSNVWCRRTTTFIIVLAIFTLILPAFDPWRLLGGVVKREAFAWESNGQSYGAVSKNNYGAFKTNWSQVTIGRRFFLWTYDRKVILFCSTRTGGVSDAKVRFEAPRTVVVYNARWCADGANRENASDTRDHATGLATYDGMDVVFVP